MSEARPGNSGRADYPRMLYQADGRMIIAHDPEEHDKLHAEGWDTEPGNAHRKPAVTPSGFISSGDPMAMMIKAAMREVLEEYGFKSRRR